MSNRAHFSGRPGTIFPEALVWIVDCHLCAHISEATLPARRKAER
jgi:hypothetical protein